MTDRVYVHKQDRQVYDDLRKESLLKGMHAKDIFLLAMGYGFASGVPREFDRKDREEFFWRYYLQPGDWALIKSIALACSSSPNILGDEDAVINLAEQFAHAGIYLLAGEIKSTSSESADRAFEKALSGIVKQLDLPAPAESE